MSLISLEFHWNYRVEFYTEAHNAQQNQYLSWISYGQVRMKSDHAIYFIEFQSPGPITNHYPNHNPTYSIPYCNFSNLSCISLKWRYTTSKYLGKPEALQRKRELCFLPIAISRQFLLPLIPKDADSLWTCHQIMSLFPYR